MVGEATPLEEFASQPEPEQGAAIHTTGFALLCTTFPRIGLLAHFPRIVLLAHFPSVLSFAHSPRLILFAHLPFART